MLQRVEKHHIIFKIIKHSPKKKKIQLCFLPRKRNFLFSVWDCIMVKCILYTTSNFHMKAQINLKTFKFIKDSTVIPEIAHFLLGKLDKDQYSVWIFIFADVNFQLLILKKKPTTSFFFLHSIGRVKKVDLGALFEINSRKTSHVCNH